MIKVIKSKDNSRLKHASSLLKSKYRKEHHEFLVEGFKALEMAHEMKLVKEIFTLEPIPNIDEEIVQNIVSIDLLNKITFSQHPEGVVFIAKEPTFNFQDDYQKILYLDGVQDPGNLGTIIRTALAFNFDAVFLSSDCVSPFNEKVVAATKGAIFKMPIFNSSLEEIKANKTVIVSSLGNNSINLGKVNVQKPYILVLGNEAHGVKEETLRLADIVCKIPISDRIESINVAVAGGIFMHYLTNIE